MPEGKLRRCLHNFSTKIKLKVFLTIRLGHFQFDFCGISQRREPLAVSRVPAVIGQPGDIRPMPGHYTPLTSVRSRGTDTGQVHNLGRDNGT